MRRFKLLTPNEEPSAGHVEHVDSPPKVGGGRRSTKTPLRPSGAWAEGIVEEPPDGKDFVYYADRRSWDEEAAIDSGRVRGRWQWRDEARWMEQERQARMRQEEKRLAEATRRDIFEEPALQEKDGDESATEEEHDESDREVEALPPKDAPVVPMILKTKSISQFDVLMDEIDNIQSEFGIRIAIVHGGLGPVIPKDVIHAEVEKQYGFCPIYAFQVGANPVAIGQADKSSIDIRRFDVFTDLLADLTARCETIHAKEAHEVYVRRLKRQPTSSGL